MIDDLNPFESSRTQLQSAETSIANFEKDVAAFIQINSYTIVRRTDNKAREDVVSYRFARRFPPILRKIASDIIGDIKHALDQATCDAALVLGATKVSAIHFPVGRSLVDLDNEIKKRLKGVHPDLVCFFRSLECHYGTNPELYTFLSLAGPTKHQRIVQLANSSDGLLLDPRNGFLLSGPAQILAGNHWNDMRNELDFLRIPQGANYKADLSPVLRIVLQEGKPPLAGDATIIFREMAAKGHAIVNAIEAETARIRGA
jgi:hypothetical protein